MSLSETMKNHMDAVRGVTGANGLLSMAMATDALKNTTTGGLMFYEIVDLSSNKYNQNLWYPVFSSKFSKQSLDRISAYIPEVNPAVMDWGTWKNSNLSTNESANAMCNVDVLMNNYGYGYNKYGMVYSLVDQYNNVRDDRKPICFDQNGYNGGYIFWLRGGSVYNLGISQSNNKWTIVESETNINGAVLKPQSYPGNLKLSSSLVKLISFEKLISELGGVTKRLLFSLVPRIGGAYYVA